MATFRPGAKDRKKVVKAEEAELEDFVFEDQIDFVSDQVYSLASSVHPLGGSCEV